MTDVKPTFSVVIPAAGEATRLRPLTTSMSKAMVPVNGKPCIDFILDRILQEPHVGEIIIVDGRLDDIRNHVKRRYGDRVRFVKQGEMKGPHHAIRVGMSELKTFDQGVVVWLGDSIILDDHIPFGFDFLMTTEVVDQSPWCMWGGIGTKLFVNKPREPLPSGLALVGLYSFESAGDALHAFMTSEGPEISDALEEYERMGHMFIDNRQTDWHDIGDPRTYHETRAKLLNRKARVFNVFDYDSDLGILTKRPLDGSTADKIIAEKLWYAELTREQSMFVPRTFECSHGLAMSMASGVLLSDLLLYDDVPESTWQYIIRRVTGIIERHFHSERMSLERMSTFRRDCGLMWRDKSLSRIKKAEFHGPVADFLIQAAEELATSGKPVGAIHGDLHLGNILYDPQTDRITLIDPRGEFGGPGKAGDANYDWAKLAHDMYFGYYALVANTAPNPLSKKIFLDVAPRDDINKILKGGLLLIATAIPLHYEDPERQVRMRRLVIDNVDWLK